jgi:hypothetical protein
MAPLRTFPTSTANHTTLNPTRVLSTLLQIPLHLPLWFRTYMFCIFGSFSFIFSYTQNALLCNITSLSTTRPDLGLHRYKGVGRPINCKRTPVLRAFVEHVKQYYELPHVRNGPKQAVNVTWIQRSTKSTKRVIWPNVEETVKKVETKLSELGIPDDKYNNLVIDFNPREYSFRRQMEIIANTDILVGTNFFLFSPKVFNNNIFLCDVYSHATSLHNINFFFFLVSCSQSKSGPLSKKPTCKHL